MNERISFHRERVPVLPGSRWTVVQHHVRVGGEDFARISSVSGLPQSWRVRVLEPDVWSGEFYGYPEARAWALEMARRKVDPSRGPIVSTKTPYGNEQPLTSEEGGR
jgi:hypothetical protein